MREREVKQKFGTVSVSLLTERCHKMNPEDNMGGVLLELPLRNAAPTFNLEKAVCSHGLFMMAPNHWDPRTKALQRPLRLNIHDRETSFMVRISHPPHSPHTLQIQVLGANALCPQQQHSLLSQVCRMLRLSEEEDKRVREFQEADNEAKKRGFGRVFRSPTLFEDMIKCILLCNCQWSRTLSMAQALCELQLELQRPLSSGACAITDGAISRCPTSEIEEFVPKTPVGKESKKKAGRRKCSKTLVNSYTEDKPAEGSVNLKLNHAEISECSYETGKLNPTLPSSNIKQCNSGQNSTTMHDVNCSSFPSFQSLQGTHVNHPCTGIGNFPSPRELAILDEKFLAKRCNLGYRAGRILNLSRDIVEGKIKLAELEEACGTLNMSDYDMLAGKLKVINGFGPFTCANVLMCMGFYHIIPSDSETIRHLKQVHAKSSTIQTVQRDVEVIYGKYAPFQFLAYWSEVWHFYEEWFGKLSEMPVSNYKLITAANMKPKLNGKSKRLKL